MSRFDGKTVVITGASSGIGESCARKFVAEGARVVLAARSPEPLQRLVEELGGDVAHAVPTDVADMSACENLLAEAKSRFGSIDVLVNNAARNSRGPLEELPTDEMLQMLDVNLRAPMVLTRLALPTMRAQGAGTIVNVASLAGRSPSRTTRRPIRRPSSGFASSRLPSRRSCGIPTFGSAVVTPGPVETGFILDPKRDRDGSAAGVLSADEHGRRDRRLGAGVGGRWRQESARSRPSAERLRR